MNSPIAWMNGSILPYSQTAVPVWDLGVVAGASVTEMARTFGHKPFRLEQHIERLTASLAALGFPSPYSTSELLSAVNDVVRHNAAFIRADSDLGIVLFSTAGSNATYLGRSDDSSTTVVHSFELPFALWRESFTNGLRLRIPAIRQIPPECFSVTHKVRNRLHWWLADAEVSRQEPGSKALLLDLDGYVTETSTSCFYIVRDGVIVTSDRSVLNSLSCKVIEELANSLGIPFEKRAIQVSELAQAEEAFLSSSAVCILPVSQIDGHAVGRGQPGPVFRQLVKAWSELTGVDIERQMLTP